MTKRRVYPCHRPGCEKLAVKLGGYCSHSCNRSWHLTLQGPEQRRACMTRIRALQWAQEMNRMIGRVRVLADTEEARLVLAWRYGKSARKAQRYREKMAS